MNKKKLYDLEKRCGVKYEPLGVVFEVPLKQIYGGPENFYFDWMHNLIASGGAAQYHVHEFILAVLKHGVTLKQLDVFNSLVVFPKTYGKFTRTLFQDRIVARSKKDTHPHVKRL